MNYNISLELTSFILLIFMAVNFFGSRKFPDKKNTHFGIYLAIAIASVAINLVGCYTISQPESVSRVANMIINELVFSLQFLIVVSLMNYIMLICGLLTRKNLGWIVLNAIVAVGFLVFIVSNVFNGWLFFFDKDLNYIHGFYYELYFIPFFGYLICSAIISITHRKRMDLMQFMMIPSLAFFVMVCMGFQYLFPEMILTGFAITLGTLIIFLNLQNPSNERDPLTKVYSRELFTKYTEELLQSGKSYPIIFANIVGTSTFNKTFGEVNGNIMISKTGQILSGINPRNLVFRYTGDSFIILVVDATQIEEFKAALLKGLSKGIFINQVNIIIQLRMFCFTQMRMETSSETLTRTLELAMRTLKKNKINEIPFVSNDLILESQRSKEIEKALRRCIQTNNVDIYLQPVIDTRTGRVAAAEALARINDPEMGLIRPTDFIPIAEETGLISALSLQVINRVCLFLKSTPLDCFKNFKWVSINLSVSDCLSKAQGEKICNIISSYNISPKRICFEITETMATIEKILPENLQVLTGKGFTLALDDFGTEYANIDSALRLPFSIAKLDRSVTHINHSGDRMKILKRTVSIFSDLRLETVAEGVDSQEMVDIAVSAGVRYIQGFFYSKPLPVNVFVNYLIQNKDQK